MWRLHWRRVRMHVPLLRLQLQQGKMRRALRVSGRQLPLMCLLLQLLQHVLRLRLRCRTLWRIVQLQPVGLCSNPARLPSSGVE